MRDDSIGFFWEDRDKRVETKREFLIERGWECFRTKWYKPKLMKRDGVIRLADEENNIVDDSLYEEVQLDIEVAYKIERSTGEKAIPPERTWERPEYLPHLWLAKNVQWDYMSQDDYLRYSANKTPLDMDIECYRNYFLIAFKNCEEQKITYFEKINNSEMQIPLLIWCLKNFRIVTFNGNHYDIPMAQYACTGASCADLKEMSDAIIQEGLRSYQLPKLFGFKPFDYEIDHIDIKELPRSVGASLKIFGGRVHTKRMQDLPFHPMLSLNTDQIDITRWYCINDLDNTYDMRQHLKEEMELRDQMSREYKIDLRSKSDAQIAEAVIIHEYKKITGKRPPKAKVEPGRIYRYNPPAYMQFASPYMNSVFQEIKDTNFVVADNGKIGLPDNLKKLKITIAGTTYKLGIGGIHSTEKAVSHISDEMYSYEDEDVESYYPRIIINQQLQPEGMGNVFQRVYPTIVDRRLKAKHAGDTRTSDSLKIVINGSFGKFGSPYSVLYAPQLLIQTTISGQLSLLMLIEALEMRGISVVSANTDGIVIRKPRHRLEEISQLVRQWEAHCGFKMEATPYKSIHSLNVNNYIAVKLNGKAKVKGSLAPGSLNLNPTGNITTKAVTDYLTKGIPVEQTITECKDIREFLHVRKVAGGAVKVWDQYVPYHLNRETVVRSAGYRPYHGGTWLKAGTSDRSACSFEEAYAIALQEQTHTDHIEYLGKAIRFYFSKTATGSIIYAKNGNRVPKSEGAKPLMELNNDVISDVNHEWYINEAYSILRNAGMDIAA